MRVAWFLSICLALTLVTTGCSSEPSLTIATAELLEDVRRLETDGLFKNPLMKLRIAQRADKDILCDKDRFKRVLRATADDERSDEPLESHLNRAQGLMENTLARIFGYKLAHDFSQMDTQEGRFIYGVKEDKGIKVTVYVAPEPPTWRIHAVTECLSR